MKILSWDVGIINLAYCIMEENNDNNHPYKIYHWNTINLLNESKIKCDICSKDALYNCKHIDMYIYIYIYMCIYIYICMVY